MTPKGIERQKADHPNLDFGGPVIGIIAGARAVGIAQPSTVPAPAAVRIGRYRTTGLTPARDLDAAAGRPNGLPFTALMLAPSPLPWWR
jgi:hypothetical protein